MAASSAHIQDRCRAVADRLEAFDAENASKFTPDLMLEAAALLRGYGQCLLLMDLPCEPLDADVDAAIDELAERAKRSVTGCSGHAWGAWAEVDRLAGLLKSGLKAGGE